MENCASTIFGYSGRVALDPTILPFWSPSMIPHAVRWVSLITLLCLTGCGNGFVWDEVLDGPYRLVAVDIDEDMSLCRSVDMSDMSGNCAGDGLPGETVFQAGSSPKYIVSANLLPQF
jgi:hypothetical protein